MELNYDVYGQPESWASYGNNINQVKVANFGSGYGLINGIVNNKLSYDEPIDPTIAFCGIGGECPFSNLVYYHNENGHISREIQAKDSTGYFIGSVPSAYNTYWDISAAFTMYDSSSAFDLGTWEKGNASTRNANLFVQPIADFKPQNIALCIYVDCKQTKDGAIVSTYLKNYIETRQYIQYPYVERVYGDILIGNYTQGGTNERTTPLLTADFLMFFSTLGEFESSYIDTCYRYNSLKANNDNSVPLLFSPLTTINYQYNNVICFGDFTEDPNFDITVDENSVWRMSYHVTTQNASAFKEMCLKAAAQYGLYFSDDQATASSGDFTDEDMYIGIIDTNGITHGNYLKGERTAEAAQAQWDSIRESPYDPSQPPAPTPSQGSITPFRPGFTLAGAGTGLWAMTKSNVGEFMNDVFGGETKKLKERLELFGQNPMNAIISLRWYPMAWTGATNGPVVLGSAIVNRTHIYPMITSNNDSVYINKGTLNIMRAYEKNFYNSRYIQARLWLPFYGFYELPSTILLSEQIELEFHYNLPDDVGVWIISFDNVIYDFCECSMGIDIPLTGSNAANQAEVKRQAALSIAAQVASTAATTVLGATGLRGLTGTANYLAEGIDILAEEALGWSGGLETQAYLNHRLGGQFNKASIAQGVGVAAGAIGGGINIANTIHNAKIEISNMKTNLPFHGAAGQTTFLNFPMYPYIQIFRNNIQSIYDETQYRLKVGHACDVWETLEKMPENSLLQTTGVADMSSSGMELGEIQELNSILQTGFYK